MNADGNRSAIVPLEISLLPDRLALARLPPGAVSPYWARGAFFAVLGSAADVTVICDEAAVPSGIESRGGFRCLRIASPSEAPSAGLIEAAVRPLADAAINVFAQSTWETAFILVNEANLEAAISALRAAGHTVKDNPGA